MAFPVGMESYLTVVLSSHISLMPYAIEQLYISSLEKYVNLCHTHTFLTLTHTESHTLLEEFFYLFLLPVFYQVENSQCFLPFCGCDCIILLASEVIVHTETCLVQLVLMLLDLPSEKPAQIHEEFHTRMFICV